jgi:hypothetical protein
MEILDILRDPPVGVAGQRGRFRAENYRRHGFTSTLTRDIPK